MNQRGHVLLQVLIMSVIIAIIAVSLSEMMVVYNSSVARRGASDEAKVAAEASFNRAITYWETGGVCSGVAGYNCSGTCSPGTCACTLSVAGCSCAAGATNSDPGRCPGTLVASLVGGQCQIQITTCN